MVSICSGRQEWQTGTSKNGDRVGNERYGRIDQHERKAIVPFAPVRLDLTWGQSFCLYRFRGGKKETRLSSEHMCMYRVVRCVLSFRNTI